MLFFLHNYLVKRFTENHSRKLKPWKNTCNVPVPGTVPTNLLNVLKKYCYTLVDLTYFNIGTGFQLKALLDRFLTALVGKGDSLENRTELHNWTFFYRVVLLILTWQKKILDGHNNFKKIPDKWPILLAQSILCEVQEWFGQHRFCCKWSYFKTCLTFWEIWIRAANNELLL